MLIGASGERRENQTVPWTTMRWSTSFSTGKTEDGERQTRGKYQEDDRTAQGTRKFVADLRVSLGTKVVCRKSRWSASARSTPKSTSSSRRPSRKSLGRLSRDATSSSRSRSKSYAATYVPILFQSFMSLIVCYFFVLFILILHACRYRIIACRKFVTSPRASWKCASLNAWRKSRQNWPRLSWTARRRCWKSWKPPRNM